MADYPIHKGSMPPFPFPDVTTFTRRIGKTVEKSSLVLLANINPFTDNLEAQEFSYHVEPHTGTPYALVSWVERDDASIISDVWELAGNDIEKDIWELPKIRAEFNKLIQALGTTTDPDNSGAIYYQWHAFVQRVVNGKVAGDDEVPGWHRASDDQSILKVPIFTDLDFKNAFAFLNNEAALPRTTPPIAAVNYQIFADLAATLSRGVNSFPLGTVVARRTRSLPPRTSIRGSMIWANVIFTKEQFKTGAAPPLEFVDSCPEGFYQYKTPTMTLQRDGTWLLNEEWYWSDEFDHFVYGNFGYTGALITGKIFE